MNNNFVIVGNRGKGNFELQFSKERAIERSVSGKEFDCLIVRVVEGQNRFTTKMACEADFIHQFTTHFEFMKNNWNGWEKELLWNPGPSFELGFSHNGKGLVFCRLEINGNPWEYKTRFELEPGSLEKMAEDLKTFFENFLP